MKISIRAKEFDRLKNFHQKKCYGKRKFINFARIKLCQLKVDRLHKIVDSYYKNVFE